MAWNWVDQSEELLLDHHVSLWFQLRSIVTVSRAYKSVAVYYIYSTMKNVF